LLEKTAHKILDQIAAIDWKRRWGLKNSDIYFFKIRFGLKKTSLK